MSTEATEALEYATCPVCGMLMFPVLPLPACGHDGPVVRSAFDTAGAVYSWTRVHAGDEGPAMVMAMADFFGGRLRVTAPVVDGGEIAIGDQVVVTAGTATPYAFRRLAGS